MYWFYISRFFLLPTFVTKVHLIRDLGLGENWVTVTPHTPYDMRHTFDFLGKISCVSV